MSLAEAHLGTCSLHSPKLSLAWAVRSLQCVSSSCKQGTLTVGASRDCSKWIVRAHSVLPSGSGRSCRPAVILSRSCTCMLLPLGAPFTACGYEREAATTGRYFAMLSFRPKRPCSASFRTTVAARHALARQDTFRITIHGLHAEQKAMRWLLLTNQPSPQTGTLLCCPSSPCGPAPAALGLQ